MGVIRRTRDELSGPGIQWLVIGHGEGKSTFNIYKKSSKFLLQGSTPEEPYIDRVSSIARNDKLLNLDSGSQRHLGPESFSEKMKKQIEVE